MGHDIRPLIVWMKAWEGGYANVPGDKGGPTNKGITLATFRSVYGQNKTIDDLKRITDDQWEYIFRTRYWNRWKADEIKDKSIAFFLVSWIWGSGVYGIKVPQRVLSVDVDGVVGPETIAAVNSRDGRQLFGLLKQEKKAYLERICEVTPTNRKFLKGWLRRLNSFNYKSLTIPTNPTQTITF
jgi:lysozyme family protein